MPRSPRATITPSAAAMIPSTASTASCVSIFATTMGPSVSVAAFARSMSAAARTNETAMASTSPATASRSARSSGVGEVSTVRPGGRATPGRPWAQPPVTTVAVARSGSTSSTTSWMAPSPRAMVSPASSSCRREAWSTAMRRS